MCNIYVYVEIYMNTATSRTTWELIYIYTYTSLPVNAIVRLLHPQSGDSQGQETFLAPSADKQTRNCDTDCSNHHLSLSTP